MNSTFDLSLYKGRFLSSIDLKENMIEIFEGFTNITEGNRSKCLFQSHEFLSYFTNLFVSILTFTKT